MNFAYIAISVRMGGNEDLTDFKGEKWKILLIQMLSMLV
jgi:hypothetical protein